MNNAPTTTKELISWVGRNMGATLERTVVVLTKDESNKVFKKHESTVMCKVSEPRPNGFYLGIDSKKSWIGLEDMDANMLFTKAYFAVIVFQDDGFIVKTYTYTDNISERRDVKMVLHCSVSDLNYDYALKNLTVEELNYCIGIETRKTGLRKLNSQLKKLNSEG